MNPYGLDRDDLRSGMVASAVYNVNRSTEACPIYRADDFLLFPEPDPPLTDDQIVDQLDALLGPSKMDD